MAGDQRSGETGLLVRATSDVNILQKALALLSSAGVPGWMPAMTTDPTTGRTVVTDPVAYVRKIGPLLGLDADTLNYVVAAARRLAAKRKPPPVTEQRASTKPVSPVDAVLQFWFGTGPLWFATDRASAPSLPSLRSLPLRPQARLRLGIGVSLEAWELVPGQQYIVRMGDLPDQFGSLVGEPVFAARPSLAYLGVAHKLVTPTRPSRAPLVLVYIH